MTDLEAYICDRYGIEDRISTPIRLPILRHQLVRLWRKFGYQNSAEIGVYHGHFSELICSTLKGHHHAIDPFAVYDGYSKNEDGEDRLRYERAYKRAKDRLAPYNCILSRRFSLEAAAEIPNGSLDCVYIDGNHSLEYIIADIAAWAPKIRVGGMLSGHDYWNSREADGNARSSPGRRQYLNGFSIRDRIRVCQVKDAVDVWVRANGIETWFITMSDDDADTWFWIVA